MADPKPAYTLGDQFCGKLVALVSSDVVKDGIATRFPGSPGGQSRYCVVEFPCMPDDITLARRATYDVKASMFLPDATHFYQHTAPLEIPFTFKLHGADPVFCGSYGPAALLDIAARLHAMTLPVKSGNIDVFQRIGSAQNGSDNAVDHSSQKPFDSSTASIFVQGNGIKPPNPVSLQLIKMSRKPTGFGIMCRGYVRDVSVKLSGPWMRGTDGQFNIPTSAEYSFTFMHVPGYSNDYALMAGGSDMQLAQAYSDDVLSSFYNTNDLLVSRTATSAGNASQSSLPPSAVLTPAGTPQLNVNPELINTVRSLESGKTSPVTYKETSLWKYWQQPMEIGERWDRMKDAVKSTFGGGD